VSAESDWSQGEIVRTLERLALTMERVELKVDGLDGKFVPREIHARDLAHLTGRLDEMSVTVVDQAAEIARWRKEQADTASRRWQFWAGIVVAGLVLPVVVALVTAQALR
jgi:hypothetical protein